MPDEDKKEEKTEDKAEVKFEGHHEDPTKMLIGIMKGEIEADKVIKFVKKGPKLDNFAMHVLLGELKNKLDYDYKKLLKVYLALDHAVEEGILTNELLETLKNNPDDLDKLLEAEDDRI